MFVGVLLAKNCWKKQAASVLNWVLTSNRSGKVVVPIAALGWGTTCDDVGDRKAKWARCPLAGAEIPTMDGLADAADPGPAMIMRAARIGDADQIREVALRSRLAGRPSLSVRDARFGALRAVTDGMIRAGEVHVAEDTPEVVGYIALQGCWITQLQVRPERRREGIGTALLGIGKERHPSGLLVCCPQHDALARHFVELRGFTAIDVLGELPMILYSWPGKSADL